MIVLVHAGVCDASMWDGFDLPGAERHELRGFGDTPMPASGEFSDADDLEARLGAGPVALVGASFGGQVCLEVAARRPELVSELVLLDAPVPDHDWSADIVAYAEEEDRLLRGGRPRRGGGPERALLGALGCRPGTTDAAALVRAAGELGGRGGRTPERIDLAAIRARTLVIVGEEDKADFRAIAERLANEIPDAEAGRDGGRDPPALARAAGGDRGACAQLPRALASALTPLLSRRHIEQHFAAGSAR